MYSTLRIRCLIHVITRVCVLIQNETDTNNTEEFIARYLGLQKLYARHWSRIVNWHFRDVAKLERISDTSKINLYPTLSQTGVGDKD